MLNRDTVARTGLEMGDEDLGQNLERVGAVNEGGFLKLFGNGSKEVHHQDDIEDGHGSRQNQGPDGIEQAVGFDNQEGGDHAAVEKHGKNHQVCIDVAAPELCVGFGEGISHQYDQHKVDVRASTTRSTEIRKECQNWESSRIFS